MNPNHIDALRWMDQSREAQKNGDIQSARAYAVNAAELAPEMEEVWLLMASLAAPRASREFLRRALAINPESQPALERLAELEPQPDPAAQPAARRRAPLLWAGLLAVLVCLVGAVLLAGSVLPAAALLRLPGFSVVEPTSASRAAGLALPSATIAPDELASATPWLPASATPSLAPGLALSTATHTPAPSATLPDTPTPLPTATETETAIPSETPTEAPSPTPLPTDTAEPTLAVPPTEPPLSAPLPAPPVTGGSTGGQRWVDVDLSEQMLYAYEGKTLVASFLVSTGAKPNYTITGSYAVYERHYKGNMWGPGYFLPDVPYIMYFYKGFALHGTYWHSNFGTPMSHGCVNLSIADAEWLYNWTRLGTPVKVHY